MADISKVNISNSDYKIKDSSAVAFGTCTGQASNQIKVVNIADTNWTLRTGCLIGVKFDANNTYSATTSAPIKLNVNNSGAKNVYGANSSTPTGTNNTFFGATNYINFYMYDGSYWVWAGRSADNNTTYTNASLGQGYGTAGTEAGGVIPVTLENYALSVGGIVAVKFSANVNSDVSLNINSTGAKPIYHKGVPIEPNVIRSGNTALFMYDGTRYHLLDIDQIRNLAVDSITLQNVGAVGGTSTNITPTGMQVGSAMRGNAYGSNGIEVGISIGNSVSISNAELICLDGATSNIQEQLDDNHNSTTALLNELSAKNLLKYPYYHNTPTTLSGVTFKVNDDGTIETSGTASATATFLLHTRLEGEINDFVLKNGTYILSGCANGGSSTTFEMAVLDTYNSAYRYLGRDYGDGVEFVVNGDDFSTKQSNLQVQITFRNGANMNGLVFKPMIRLASISDDTFVPYSETNRQLTNSKMSWESQNVLGAKNLLKYPYYQGTTTNNGVTFTVHFDGTITTSGTASASATANLLLHTRIEGETNDFVLKNGRYLVNGCASGGSNDKWYISYQYTNKSNQFAVLATDYGDGDTELVLNGDYFSDDEVNLQVAVAIAKGVNADGLVFKPMIRLESTTDDTYTPYAMTNQELTKAVLELLSRIN